MFVRSPASRDFSAADRQERYSHRSVCVADPEDLAGYPVRPGPALGLLEGYIQSLTTLDEPPSPELAQITGDHLLDLVAAALGPTAGTLLSVAASRLREHGKYKLR